jgi:phosphate starvation-inducible protein PhoH
VRCTNVVRHKIVADIVAAYERADGDRSNGRG